MSLVMTNDLLLAINVYESKKKKRVWVVITHYDFIVFLFHRGKNQRYGPCFQAVPFQTF